MGARRLPGRRNEPALQKLTDVPYRSKQSVEEKQAPKTGFVADIVRQFADPYAFFRELVQNSVDAGTEAVEVRIFRSESGVTRSSVTDSGQGMSLSVLQNNLLTLFSSTKEGDSSKVGKYGVGFVSVLSTEPEEVVVETWRDGQAHRLRLFRDHSYEIERLAERPGSGTTVALVKTTTAEEHQAHCAASLAALRRWCRHARVPIRVTIGEADVEAKDRHERIDEPITLDALVSVRVERDGDVYVVGVGRPLGISGASPARVFSGFYKGGLTLYESHSEAFAGLEHVSFKVESSRFTHTLSRDNVRRDANMTAALDELRQIQRDELRRALLLQITAEAAGVAAEASPAKLCALYEAARSYAPPLGRDELCFPLTEPMGEATVMTAEELNRRTPWRKPFLVAKAKSSLSYTLNATGYPVVLAADHAIRETLSGLFREDALISPRTCQRVGQAYVLLEPLEEDLYKASDIRLCEEVAACLRAARRPVSKVVLGRTSLPDKTRTGYLLPADAPRLLASADVPKRTNQFGRNRQLYLNVQTPAVRVARRKAQAHLAAAALLLARTVVVEADGPLSERDADALVSDYPFRQS